MFIIQKEKPNYLNDDHLYTYTLPLNPYDFAPFCVEIQQDCVCKRKSCIKMQENFRKG